jgi:hypothetical protein
MECREGKKKPKGSPCNIKGKVLPWALRKRTVCNIKNILTELNNEQHCHVKYKANYCTILGIMGSPSQITQ